MFSDIKDLLPCFIHSNEYSAPNSFTSDLNLNNLDGVEFSQNSYKTAENSQSSFWLNSSNIEVNESIKKKLKKLLSQYPEGIWCSDLSKLYAKNYHYALDYKEFGCTSLIHFASQIPDVIKCVRPGQGDWLLFDASQSEFPDSFCSETNFKKDLIPSDFHEIEKKHEDQLSINHDSLSVFPADVVGLYDSWVKIDLGDLDLVGTQFQVSTAEVWSPSKFFIHLKKFSNFVEKFISDLQDFYNINFAKYKMPESIIKPKQICVGYYSTDCMTKEEWHRMEILQVLSKKTVIAYMVDFGTVSLIKKTHLRFLHKGFLTFPIQAIPAKLVGIQPLNGADNWPQTTSLRFLELLRVPALEAKVVEIDQNFSVEYSMLNKPSKSNFECMHRLGLILHEAYSPKNSSINEQLVDEGLAVIDGRVLFTKDQMYDYEYGKENEITENPIFDEINEGKFVHIQCENDQKDDELGTKENILLEKNEINVTEDISQLGINHVETSFRPQKRQSLTFNENQENLRTDEKTVDQDKLQRTEVNLSKFNFPPIMKPPGLENVNIISNINLNLLLHVLLEQEHLNKNENLTISSLLIKNQDLQKIAWIDPLWALWLAFQISHFFNIKHGT